MNVRTFVCSLMGLILFGAQASFAADAPAKPKAPAASTTVAKTPAPQAKPTEANLAYGTNPRQVLDFYQAQSSQPTPLVFHIHGGGWVAGDKASVGGPNSGAQSVGYNCQLYHMDHKTLPDGPATYLNTERPLLDNGNPLGQYVENQCEEKELVMDAAPTPVPVKAPGGGPPLSLTDDILNGNNGQFNLDAEGQDCDHTGTCYDGK